MSNPGFEISILQRNKIIQFEPSFAKFHEVVLRVYDQMIEAVSRIPRLETKLYIDLEDTPKELRVTLQILTTCLWSRNSLPSSTTKLDVLIIRIFYCRVKLFMFHGVHLIDDDQTY